MMQTQTERPTESGWYYVTHDAPDDELRSESWQMYYFDAEQQRLYGFCPEMGCLDMSFSVTRWQMAAKEVSNRCRDLDCGGTWTGPRQWMGPIRQPQEAVEVRK
jgi:hypothetical protein